MRWLLAAVAFFALMPAAYATCSNPTQNEGDIIYNDDFNVVQYCDGTNWIRMGGSAQDQRIGTLTATKWCAVNAGGTAIDCTQNAPTSGISALTGDVTASGTGSVAATIAVDAVTSAKILDGTIATGDLADKAVTYAKIQDTSAASVLLGRGAGSGAGAVQELTLGSGLSLSGTTLSATGSLSGTGTTNYLAKFTGAAAIGDSAIFESGGNVGIGTTSPGSKFDVITASGPNTERMRVASASNASVWFAPHVGAGSWNGISQSGDQGIYFQGSGGQGTGNLVIAPWAAGVSGIRINSSGNVGIGTAAPTLTLDVGSAGLNAPADTGTTNNGLMRIGYNARSWPGTELNVGITNAPPYPFWLQSQKPTDLSVGRPLVLNPIGGDVGIGTTAPQSTLDVNGGARVGADATCAATKAGMIAWNANKLQVCTDAGTFTDLATSTGVSGSSQWVNGTSGAIYYNGGNVGIGTTDPTLAKLQIETTDASANIVLRNTSSTVARFPGFAIYNFAGTTGGAPSISGVNSRGSYASPSPVQSGDALLQLVGNGQYDTTTWHSFQSGTIGIIAAGTFSSSSAPTAITFNTTASGSVTRAERMRVDASGNVGIGTASPRSALDVAGRLSLKAGAPANDSAAVGLAFEDNGDTGLFMTNYTNAATGDLNLYTNATPRLTVLSGGNVGIGTTTPAATLDVAGDVSLRGNRLNFGYATSTPASGPAIKWSDGGNTNVLGFYVNAGLNFQGNASNPAIKIRIPTTDGTLGSEIIHLGAASTTDMSWFAGGNVGIGTTSPQADLDVQGYARLAKYSAQPVACAAANDGAIALTHVYTLCVCKGGATAWVKASDGATACAW